VVLAGDVHPTGFHVFDRVVGAVMAVRQARRAGPGGAAHDLVAQTDSEHRDAPERLARQLDRPLENRRVTGPVREHQAVDTGRGNVRPGRGVWKHDHAASALPQRAEDVQLDAVVDDRDRQACSVRRVRRAKLGREGIEPLFGRGARRLRDQVLLGKRGHSTRCRGQAVQALCIRTRLLMREDGAERSVLAYVPGQGARVDVGDRGYAPSP